MPVFLLIMAFMPIMTSIVGLFVFSFAAESLMTDMSLSVIISTVLLVGAVAILIAQPITSFVLSRKGKSV